MSKHKQSKYQIIFHFTGFWFMNFNKHVALAGARGGGKRIFTGLAYIYDWALGLGFVEIRRFKF